MARLVDISIPEPNAAVAEFKRSPRMHEIMAALALTAAVLTTAKVPKRTGAESRSVRSGVEFGGHRQDGWVGQVTIGTGHALPNQFGATVPLFGDREHSHVQPGAHDLNWVLATLEAFG